MEYKDELKTPHIVTSNQTYIKFIGDRSIDDKDFKIVKNRDKEMIEYFDIINKIQDDIKERHTISVAFNNHFADFGPQSANSFLKLMGRPAINGWAVELEQSNSIYTKHGGDHQKCISDYNHFKI